MSNLYDNPPFDSYTEPPVMPQLSDAGAQPSGGLTLSDLLAQYAALSQAAQQPVQIAPPEKRSGVEKALTILQPLAQAFAISSATREWRRRRAAFLGSLAAGGAETALNEAIRPRLQREQMAERQKAAEQERFNRMAVVTGIAPNILRAQAELARAGREPIAREPHQYITDESGNLVDVTGNQATPVTRQEPVLGTMPMPTLPTPTEQAPPIEPSGTGVGAPSDLGLGLNWAGILGPELPAGTTQVPTGATRQTPVKVFQKPAAQRNAPGGMWGEHYNKAEQAVLDSGGSPEEAKAAGLQAVADLSAARRAPTKATQPRPETPAQKAARDAKFQALDREKDNKLARIEQDFRNPQSYAYGDPDELERRTVQGHPYVFNGSQWVQQ